MTKINKMPQIVISMEKIALMSGFINELRSRKDCAPAKTLKQ